MTRTSLLAPFLLALAIILPSEARAHAVLLESSPADGALLADPPPAITLRFNEPVRPIAIRVLDATRDLKFGPAAIETENEDVRLTPAKPLAGGTYLVTYRVASLDSHPVSGTFVFTVGAAAGSRPLAVSPYAHEAAWQIAATLARAIWYGILLLVSGLALFLGLIAAPEDLSSRFCRVLPPIALAGILAGALALGVSGGALQGEGALTLLTTAPWLLALGSPVAASAAVASLGLAVLALAGRNRRAPMLVGAGLLALSFALSGHAMTAEPRWLMMPAVALHALLAAFWLGSLWPLLVAVRRYPPEQAGAVLAAFSRVALPAVALLVLAGVLLALLELRSWSDLLGSAYGQRLTLKLVLVAALLALGAANRWLLTPALLGRRAASAPWLRRTLGLDLLLAAGIVAMTASLGAVPPPRRLATDPTGQVAHHHHQAHAPVSYAARAELPGAKLELVVTPSRVGRNRVELHFMDDAGHPLAAQAAELRLSLPERGVEPLRVEAKRTGEGQFAAPAVALPLPGRWEVRADLLVDDFTKLMFRTRIEVAR